MFAAQAGQADCVPALASLQARKQNSRGLTAMMLAAYKGYASIVEILMPKETRIQDDEGRTALVYALFGQHKDVVKLLIDSERDIPTKQAKQLSSTHYPHRILTLLHFFRGANPTCSRVTYNRSA